MIPARVDPAKNSKNAAASPQIPVPIDEMAEVSLHGLLYMASRPVRDPDPQAGQAFRLIRTGKR